MRTGETAGDWQELVPVIDECIAELLDEDRELLLQHYLAGHTQRELAEERSISQSAVGKRLNRVVEALRQGLQGKGVVPSVAVLTALLTEMTADAAVPAALTGNLLRIGLVGVGTSAAGAGSAAATLGTAGATSLASGTVLSTAAAKTGALAVAGAVLVAGVVVYKSAAGPADDTARPVTVAEARASGTDSALKPDDPVRAAGPDVGAPSARVVAPKARVAAEPGAGIPRAITLAAVDPATGSVSESTQAAELDVEAVLARVAAREARVTSARCRWTREIRITPASMADPMCGPNPLETDRVGNGSGYAAFDGSSSLRYEYTADAYRVSTGTFHPYRAVFVQSRGRLWRYSENLPRAQSNTDNGGIASAPGPWYRGEMRGKPFLRAFHMSSWAQTPEFNIVGHAERDGHPCVVLEVFEALSLNSRRILVHWWLAEDMDYSVLAWRQLAENQDGLRALSQVDYSYEQDERIGWRLTSWRWSYAPTGAQVLGTVTDLQINEPIKPEEFEVTFPPGTRVTDLHRGLVYRVGSEEDERDLKALQAIESTDTLDRLVKEAKRMMGVPVQDAQETQK